MIAAECPFCHVHSTFELVQAYELPPFLARRLDSSPRRMNMPLGRDQMPTYEVVRCMNEACRMVASLVVSAHRDIWKSYPEYVVGKEFPDVPSYIASTADEAFQCLSIGASRAAVALARAVIEASAKDKQITTGNLWAKIDKMAEAGHITESARLAAHEVRFAGNDVAHGDLVDHPLEAEDAVTILELMVIMLASVYQEPAKVLRVKESRLARSVKSQGDSEAPKGDSV